MSSTTLNVNSQIGALTTKDQSQTQDLSKPNADAVNQVRNAFQAALGQAQDAQGRLSGILAGGVPAGQTSGLEGGALKFSSHALERMQSRGISISKNEMDQIENAIARAAQKGSKDTLVLAQDKALIVSVKNKTVVTVMDRSSMRENVFTNIDSTVMV